MQQKSILQSEAGGLENNADTASIKTQNSTA